MDGYILDLRNKFQHMRPKKPQYSPQKHRPIDYGATQQLLQPTDTSPLLNEKGIKKIQGIVGALLYVGRAFNNKLLVALSAIWSQQAAATEDTAASIEQLLYYVATYPNYGYSSEKAIWYWQRMLMWDFWMNQGLEAEQARIYSYQKINPN